MNFRISLSIHIIIIFLYNFCTYIINHNIEEGNYPNDTISLIFLIEILLLTHRMPCELNRYQTLIRQNYILPMLLLINEK